MIYFDSSALVKRYIEEKGSDKINGLLRESSISAVSRLAYPEILAAMTRRHKAKGIETGAFERVKKAFKDDWSFLTVIELHHQVFQFIDEMIARYALKGADSVQLSSALWLKKSTKGDVIFVASDPELIQAAKAEKLKVFNPEQ